MRERIPKAVLTICILVLWLQPCLGRPVRMWGYDELWEKADLVVIAKPVATKDLDDERKLAGTSVVGQETTFEVTVCMKGKLAEADEGKKPTFKLYHYRLDDSVTGVTNGPLLLHLPKDDKSQYLMFLKRTDKGKDLKDALYEPRSAARWTRPFPWRSSTTGNRFPSNRRPPTPKAVIRREPGHADDRVLTACNAHPAKKFLWKSWGDHGYSCCSCDLDVLDRGAI